MDTGGNMVTQTSREVQARIDSLIDATWAFSALAAASEIRCHLRDPDGHLIEVGQTTGTPRAS